MKQSKVSQRSNRDSSKTRESLAKLHDLLSRIRKLALFVEEKEESETPVYSIIFENNIYTPELKIFKCIKHQGSLPKSLRQFLTKQELSSSSKSKTCP